VARKPAAVAPGQPLSTPNTADEAFERALRIGLEKARLGKSAGGQDFYSTFKDIENSKNHWQELGPKP
jgi:hypothetical protein